MKLPSRWRFTLASALITLSLLFLLRMSVELAFWPVPAEIKPGVYDTLNLEERRYGWTTLTLAVVMLLITWIPFRRGKLWAWITTWIFLAAYAYPVHIYPAGFGPDWLVWQVALGFLPVLLGLLIAMPDFSWKKPSRVSPHDNPS